MLAVVDAFVQHSSDSDALFSQFVPSGDLAGRSASPRALVRRAASDNSGDRHRFITVPKYTYDRYSVMI